MKFCKYGADIICQLVLIDDDWGMIVGANCNLPYVNLRFATR
ncbi:hypothetical protein [Moraxella lacunata]